MADGGPARNSFELNVTLNQIEDVTARLLWFRGTVEESVLASYDGSAGPVPKCRPKRVENIWHLISNIRQADAVIVHGYYLGWVLPSVVIAAITRIPVVITPHGSLTKRQQKFSVRKKAFFDATAGRIIRRYIKSFVTGSRIEAEQLLAKFPRSSAVAAGVGTPIPDGISDAGEWSTPPRLLLLSRITRKKRHDLAIEAVAELVAQGIPVELDIVGTGSAEDVRRLKNQASVCQVTDLVHFHGQKVGAAKRAAFENADIFILPSEDENFGISVAEALAHGVPTICSREVAASEGLPFLAGSRLVTTSPQDLADAVKELLSRDRAEARRVARAFAEQTYSWESAACKWLDALGSTCGLSLASADSDKPKLK
ncbi:glycosyltransferase [Sinomonas gamaensis]|uniref:glycosyltransferase n=1 Tax=Sinomonas gamaensis TaxID=2565624 RepID=UPI001487120F|nr:glycosyltransferase [Sinomonas gamaensis]